MTHFSLSVQMLFYLLTHSRKLKDSDRSTEIKHVENELTPERNAIAPQATTILETKNFNELEVISN